MNGIEQYQRVKPETALMTHECARDPGRVTVSLASIEGRGCLADLAAAPWATRGVNSEVEQAAGISPTRLSSVSPGPDFIFLSKYLGGN